MRSLARSALIIALFATTASAQDKSALRYFTSEADFRAAASNPALDEYTDLHVTQNLRQPMARARGLYRYRLSARPFGLFISASETEPWISVMDPPQSTLIIDGFRPSVRAVGAYLFGAFQAHQKSNVTIKVTVVTSEGRTTTTLHDTSAQTFFGVSSSRIPILSVRVEAVQDFPFELYPSVRAVILGSAVIASDGQSPG